MDKTIEALTGTTVERKKSKLPAKLDFIQSGTGLFLALFMIGHMFLVSSILISKDFMYSVAKMLEGSFIFEGGNPLLVTIAAAVIFTIFIVHAALGLRKFPINYRQFMKYREHMKLMKHEDTSLWFWQVITGFAMFFMGSVHLYIMMTQPDTIGPYGSADRMVSQWMWPLYLLLLLAVEFHGSIGLYRLAVKWGWFDGDNPRENRAKMKKFKWYNTVFFLTLGILTLIAYIKIGIEHKPNAGEKYVPETSYNIQLDAKARLS
jgi:fumarate reductase subunit C